MADEKEDSPSAAGNMPRVRRRAPTIELKATEVAVEPPPSGSDAPSQSAPEPESAAPPEYSTQPPDYDRAAAEPPRSEPPPPTSSDAVWYRFFDRPAVEASLAGGLAALIVFIVLWLGGMFSRPEGTLSPRVAVLETRLRELASRPPPVAPDMRPVDELSARITRLEGTASNNANAGGAASEETIKSLQAGAADLARRVNDNATAIREARGQADAALKAADAARVAAERNDMESSSNVAALDRMVKGLADDVAKSIAAAGDKPLRAAVAAQALQAAVERGAPFAAELTATKAVLGNSQAVAALEPFAASGLPAADKLARELSDITPAMLKAKAASPAAGGFLDRLQANAEKLVSIRRLDEAAGDDPGAVISRAQAKAARGDLAGAAADLKTLPADVRAPADEWIKKVEARRGALDASHRVVADALDALGKSSP